MTRILRSLAIGFVLGLLSAVFILALPIPIQLPLVGVALGVAGGAYVGFALTAASPTEQATQWAGVVAFLLIGAMGIGVNAWFLAGGWLLHAAWDLWHHGGRRGKWVPENYPLFCLAYDVVLAALAAYIALETV
jgi:MFS family permease